MEIMIDLLSVDDLRRDLTEVNSQLAIFGLAQGKGLDVFDGTNVEKRLSELKEIKSRIEEQLIFRNGEI